MVAQTVADDLYWEFYDDQSSADFSYLSYFNLKNELVFTPTERNLQRQVDEIRRQCGDDVEIKVYAKE